MPVSLAVPLTTESRLRSLYYVMQSTENMLGGGEGIEGMYGSIKRLGMHKVIESLRQHCDMDSQAHFLDIGAGIGRPLLHALLAPGVAGCTGIELDRIKVDKSAAFFKRVGQELKRRMIDLPLVPTMHCSAVEEVKSLEPATHAYSFWEGVPPSGKAAFGRLFADSASLKAVAVVQRAIRGKDPCDFMAQLGFGPLVLVTRFPVSMSGSGQSFTAYVFKRARLPESMGVDKSSSARQGAAACESPDVPAIHTPSPPALYLTLGPVRTLPVRHSTLDLKLVKLPTDEPGANISDKRMGTPVVKVSQISKDHSYSVICPLTPAATAAVPATGKTQANPASTASGQLRRSQRQATLSLPARRRY